jgi:hypothetical protein
LLIAVFRLGALLLTLNGRRRRGRYGGANAARDRTSHAVDLPVERRGA